MPCDWRALLTELRIEFVERGRNTSRNNVNIACPFCGGDDPSYHMSISLIDKGYYCYRGSRAHQGSDPIRLLTALGLTRARAVQLYNAHVTTFIAEPETRPEVREVIALWHRMRPAHESPLMLQYLIQRDFIDAERVARQYDLRCTPYGRYAGRLLFPLHDAEGQASFTGRLVNRRDDLRYLAQATNTDSMVYLPRALRRDNIVVEGPADALKVAAATETHDISSVALLGLASNQARLGLLRRISQHCHALYVSLDNMQSLRTSMAVVNDIAAACGNFRGILVRRLAVPTSYKDCGEMTYGEITTWLNDAGLLQVGKVASKAGHVNG